MTQGTQNANSGNSGHTQVTIHIDKTTHKATTPTTGQVLYELGKVDSEKYDLFREVHGNGDDELIADDGTAVTLKDGDHFNSVQKDLNPG
jgi:hypothetical protein